MTPERRSGQADSRKASGTNQSGSLRAAQKILAALPKAVAPKMSTQTVAELIAAEFASLIQ